MAVQNITTLKSYFNTGDTPTEAQFADLMDTLFDKEIKTGFVALASVAGIQVPIGKNQLYYTHEITAAGTQQFSFDATATYEQDWVAAHFVITNSHTANETRSFPAGWHVRANIETADGSYSAGVLTVATGKTVEVNILNTGTKKIVKIDSIGDAVV